MTDEIVDMGDNVVVLNTAAELERVNAVLFKKMGDAAAAKRMGLDGRFKIILVARIIENLVRILRHNDAAVAELFVDALARLQAETN